MTTWRALEMVGGNKNKINLFNLPEICGQYSNFKLPNNFLSIRICRMPMNVWAEMKLSSTFMWSPSYRAAQKSQNAQKFQALGFFQNAKNFGS